jgi:hypothetical protein
MADVEEFLFYVQVLLSRYALQMLRTTTPRLSLRPPEYKRPQPATRERRHPPFVFRFLLLATEPPLGSRHLVPREPEILELLDLLRS